MPFEASYLKIFQSGELLDRAESAIRSLENCVGCPHECSINRFNTRDGICKSGNLPIVSSYSWHFGEEPVLTGTRGAGNIFFGNCNLKCVFCQNFEISQNWENEIHKEITYERLAEIMIELQNMGCHNIGLVSPTHFSASILKSVSIAAGNGLSLPLIYNSNGYDSIETLKFFDGVVDIYLPDFKYGDNEYAKKFSFANNYFETAKASIKEMFKQVGPKLIYKDGVIVRGLIIRHLVLPNGLAESENIFRFIAEELDPEIHISLMSQYYPAHKADKEILLSRTVRQSEYEKTLSLMDKYKLHNGWFQEMDSSGNYRPAFDADRKNPFNNQMNVTAL